MLFSPSRYAFAIAYSNIISTSILFFYLRFRQIHLTNFTVKYCKISRVNLPKPLRRINQHIATQLTQKRAHNTEN